jgi:hypothetical protein
MNKILKKLLRSWVLNNFPFNETTKINHIKTILIKKRRIKEWRSYDENHKRIKTIF